MAFRENRNVVLNIGVGLLTAAVFSSCSDSTVTAESTGDFPSNIHAVMSNNCLGGDCHSTATPLNDSLDLTSWNALMTTGRFAEIIPYRAINSHLFQHLNTNGLIDASADPLMPLGRDPLSLNDQGTIMAWINAGAKDFSGTVPYTVIPNKLFVLHPDQDLLSVIDRDRERLARVEIIGNDVLEQQPSLGSISEVLSRDGKTLFVAFSSGLVRTFDATSYQKLGELPLTSTPTSITLSPDNTKGYLANAGTPDAHSFTVFDPHTLQVLRTIESDQILGAAEMVVSSDGSREYLICSGGDDVKIIATQNDSIIGHVKCGSDVPQSLPLGYNARYQPSAAVLSSDQSTLYVTLHKTNEVVAIDVNRDSIISRIAVDYGPMGIAGTPDGSELWVANENADDLSVINTASGSVVATVDSVSQYPVEVMVSRDGATVYATSGVLPAGGHHHSSGGGPPSGVFVIDRASRQITKTIEMPPLASSIVSN
jgi:YVTN family beta-propeller protein